MGRTVNTWRTRLENEMESLAPFRRSLPLARRDVFDSMLRGVRQMRNAGGMLPGHEPWKPMLLSMLLEAHVRIEVLEARLNELEGLGSGCTSQ